MQEAARLDPSSGETHYQLGLALARAGKKDDAAVELAKGRELSAAGDRTKNASLDIAEGRAALDRGSLDEAAQKFRHAVQVQPDSADAQQYLDPSSRSRANQTKPSRPTRKRSSSTRHRRSRKRASRR